MEVNHYAMGLAPIATQFCGVAGKLHLLSYCGSVDMTLLQVEKPYKEWNIKYVLGQVKV